MSSVHGLAPLWCPFFQRLPAGGTRARTRGTHEELRERMNLPQRKPPRVAASFPRLLCVLGVLTIEEQPAANFYGKLLLLKFFQFVEIPIPALAIGVLWNHLDHHAFGLILALLRGDIDVVIIVRFLGQLAVHGFTL